MSTADKVIETQFIDNALDVINSFHRDERKAQVRDMRSLAKIKLAETSGALGLGSQADPFFVQDKAREFAREYLVSQYGEHKVTHALGSVR